LFDSGANLKKNENSWPLESSFWSSCSIRLKS
jgi:hypothetical protein